MSTACVKHPMTVGDQICSGCGHTFCRECIVFPFGEKKPGLCIGCALERGGVRSRATTWPRLPRKSIKERLRTARNDADEGDDPTRDHTDDTDPADGDTPGPWLGDDDAIDGIPGAWSATYR